MPRIRSIKPDFFTSLTVGQLSLSARLSFIGLWTHVDDDGRTVDDARLIRAAVWPLDDRTLDEVDADLAELATAKLLIRYEVDGRRYLAVRSWREHQRVDRPTRSRYPEPPADEALAEASTTARRTLDEDSRASRAPAEQGAGSREQGEEQGRESPTARASAREAPPAGGSAVVAAAAHAGIPEKVTAQQLVGAWLKRQPKRPPEQAIRRQGDAAARLARDYTGPELAAAFVGIETMYPHAPPRGQPWDLFDLERKFAKATAAAAHHPELRRKAADREFDEILDAAGAT